MTSEAAPRSRLVVLGVVALGLFAMLFTRLWYLQVLSAPDYAAAAESNRIRVVVDQAPRGRVLDVNQNVLVENREQLLVTVDVRVLEERTDGDEEREEFVARLAGVLTDTGLPTTSTEIEERLSDESRDPFKPVVVAEDVPETLEVFLLERRQELPGVGIERRSVRSYPYGALAAHVIGYTGELNEDELEARQDHPKNYEPGDEVGKTGVEAIYEEELRGQPGETVYEVDSSGEIIREVTERAKDPVPGNDIMLTIDIDVQFVVEQALEQQLKDVARDGKYDDPPRDATAGSGVVTDPADGAVGARASYPAYHPEEFIGGIEADRFEALTDPLSHFPFNNRAIQGQYAPGSTFKLFTALAALDVGLINPEDTIEDGGVYVIEGCTGGKCEFTNAGEAAYGLVNLRRALTVSSDVYFYRLGDVFWIQREAYGDSAIQDVARDYGFASRTGIPLPQEESGVIADPELKQQRNEEFPELFPFGEWFTGDNMNIAVGQGDLAVTPLQLTNAYAAFANGGTLYSPNIATAVVTETAQGLRVIRRFEPRTAREIDLSDEFRIAIQEGMLGATGSGEGTAVEAFSDFDLANWPVAGKTGTAEVDDKADTSVFVAFGPASTVPGAPGPQYVVGVILEEAGFGADAAAPLVKNILDPITDVLPKAQRVELVYGIYEGQLVLEGSELLGVPG